MRSAHKLKNCRSNFPSCVLGPLRRRVTANFCSASIPGSLPIFRIHRAQRTPEMRRTETLLVAGISNAGTAAAGEFLANPDKMNSVYRGIRATTRGREFPHDWEILIKIAVRDGLPLDPSVIAIRPAFR